MDELQVILHSKPLTNWTPSMAAEIAEDSSKDANLRLFLQTSKIYPKISNSSQNLLTCSNLKKWKVKYVTVKYIAFFFLGGFQKHGDVNLKVHPKLTAFHR